LGKELGYAGNLESEKELLEFLKQIPASKLALYCNAIVTQEEERDYEILAFAPVIEPYVGDDCVIPKSQHEQLSSAWGNQIPLIIGGTSFEGLFSYRTTLDDPLYMLSAFEAIIPKQVREAILPSFSGLLYIRWCSISWARVTQKNYPPSTAS